MELRDLNKAKTRKSIRMAYKKDTGYSVDELCKVAQISRGTFFNYFDSKESFQMYYLGWHIINYRLNHSNLSLEEYVLEKNKDVPLNTWLNILKEKSYIEYLQFIQNDFIYEYQQRLKPDEISDIQVELLTKSNLIRIIEAF